MIPWNAKHSFWAWNFCDCEFTESSHHSSLCSTSSGRGYLNHMATLRPNSASGQLSDPDSGCFSSHSNEAPGGWLEPHFGPASVAANGGIIGGGGVPMPMLIDSSSSPLSSSSSMSHHQPQQIPNNKLLAHTLENRKRVLHTLIREKTDTLVWCCATK